MVQLHKTSNTSGKEQTACKQCGICCTKGGAALHRTDISILRKKLIPRRDLITLRKGEFAHNPVSDKVQATSTEIVKLRGTNGEWTCCYYNPSTCGCTIYAHRPLACRTLRCWDPQESLALVETDLLSRMNILDGEKVLQELVIQYEEACPLPDFNVLSLDIRRQPEKSIAALEDQINADVRFRDRAVQDSTTVAQEELFLFGRPLFQLLHPFGFTVFQSGNVLRLQWKGIKRNTS
ncbi:MAG: YkgJ family cysteine cluster protein [Desulfocapsa sp.]|nr:YkgJ family cysteine cluster protein [Desulfocapsa sp.]